MNAKMQQWGLISSWQRQRVPTPAVPRRASPWARLANFVKKPSLIFNVTYLESNGFNASMWVSWSLSDLKKSQCIDQYIQIHQICVNKYKYENHIKFEVSLHFLPIWPTVCHGWCSEFWRVPGNRGTRANSSPATHSFIRCTKVNRKWRKKFDNSKI